MRVVLLDQNLTRELVPWLRQRRPDWTVHRASDLGLGRATDDEISDWARHTTRSLSPRMETSQTEGRIRQGRSPASSG